jgi:DNA-binding response OmpR family regulator
LKVKKSSTHTKKILLVEDEESIRMFCERVLIDEGFVVDLVANGQAGKEKIEAQKYDLHIFDIKMPLMSGMELFNWLKKTYPQIAKRVMFITGSVIGEDTGQFLQTSGRPVLYKPFSIDELKNMVQTCLENNKEAKDVNRV